MPYALDKYRAEAKIGPFVLDLGDGHEITVPVPTGEVLLELGEITPAQSRRFLQLLLGDQFDTVYEKIRAEPYEIMLHLAADMARHFKLDAESISQGGFGASPR